MIPVYCIVEEVECEEARRQLAEGALSGELTALSRAIREWDRIVALLHRPAVNDNKRPPALYEDTNAPGRIRS
jgi:hypothetical protein